MYIITPYKFIFLIFFIGLSIVLSAQVDPVIDPNQKSDVFNYSVLENKPLFGGAESFNRKRRVASPTRPDKA